jgi:hypothetical protein
MSEQKSELKYLV